MFPKNQKVFMQTIKYKPFSLFVVLVIFCGKNDCVDGQVPLTEFMPYKASDGAVVISLGDTDNHEVRLGFTFKYYGQEYTYVYIHSNGYVYFNWTSWDVFIGCKPLHTDLDPSAGGTVSYKISQDKKLLLRLSNDISKSSSEVQNVSLTNSFAATWNNVPHYYGKNTKNTFQAVLTTDGYNSFVLFYYNKVEIPPGNWAYAQLRNNARDVMHDLANTNYRNISALLSGSNINVPGKWVFQVNPCASLKHYERTISNELKASTLGQGALLIPLNSSHCISKSHTGVANCKFESEKEVSSTTGILLAGKQLIICPLPLFLTSGEFLVEVVVNITHNSTVMTRTLRTKLFVEESEDRPEPQLSIEISIFGSLIVSARWRYELIEIGNDFPCCGFETGHTSIRLLKKLKQGGWVDLGNLTASFENSGLYKGTLDMSAILKKDSYSDLAIAVQQMWKFNEIFALKKQTVASIFQTEKFLEEVKNIARQVKLVDPSKHISVFGNVPLLLQLPFIPQFLFNVKCNFIEANNNLKSSTGMLLSREQLLVICPVPFLSSVGIVNIQVQFGYKTSNVIFYGVFYAAREKDFDSAKFAQILNTSSTDEEHALLHVSLNPAWKTALLASDVIDFFNVSQTNNQIVFYNYDGNHWEEIFTSNCSPLTEYVNVGLQKKELLEIFASGNQIAVGIRETFETSCGQRVSGVTFLRMKDAYWLLNDLKELSGFENSESGENAECKKWFEQDEFSTNTDMSCPKTVTQAKRDWRFIEGDHKTCFQMSEKNPLAFTQAIASVSGKGVLCLYDRDGNLSNQSHAQTFSSTNRKNYWTNYFYDTIPFMHCCRSNSEEANCKNLYLTKRAQEDGSHYAPLRFALAVSTGKIFPFDSEMYRILTLGEFWVLKYTNDFTIKRRGKHASFKMQVRVEQYIGADKKTKPVPVITAVALLDQNGHKNFSMQVSKDKNKPEMAIRINKEELYTIPKQQSSQIFYFDQGTIQYFSSSDKLLVTFKSGFSVLVTTAGENEMGINLIASATGEQFQNSSGFLTGKPTHRHTEELDSVKETEIVDLMNTKLVLANESIFAYQTDKPYSYYGPNVTLKLPDTIDTAYEMQSNCQVNPIVDGMVDLVLTGSESVANSTRDVVEYFVELSKDS